MIFRMSSSTILRRTPITFSFSYFYEKLLFSMCDGEDGSQLELLSLDD